MYQSSPSVTEIGEGDISGATIRKCKGLGLVLFYATWCGHCQHFKPEYEKLGRTAMFMNMYAVDCGNEAIYKKVSKNLEIRGYPTIYLYKDGNPVEEFQGKREWKDLLKYAMDCKQNHDP